VFRAFVTAVALCVAATSALADVCKAQLSLAGGSIPGGTSIRRHDPLGVVYIHQWSLFSYSPVSADTDLVSIQIEISWKSIAVPGKGYVWIAGLPPQVSPVPCSGGADCLTFANGAGNYGGFIAPTGVQLSMTTNPVLAPAGLAFVTASDQGAAEPTDLQWDSALSTGPGRLRMLVTYFTLDASLQGWLVSQPSATLVCGL